MDEPLSNLDAKLRVSMRTELREIHDTIKATSIFVTHDQSEAMSLADRIVIINRGKIEQIGTRLKCIRKVPRSLLPPSSGLLQPISSRR